MVYEEPKLACIYMNRVSLYSPSGGIPEKKHKCTNGIDFSYIQTYIYL